jgi:hypothetical protein
LAIEIEFARSVSILGGERMNTAQAARLFSSNVSERETSAINLAIVCLWSIAGLMLTVVFLGFGVEIGQALAVAG